MRRELIGVNVTLEKRAPAQQERAVALLRALGVQRVRLELDWYREDIAADLEPFVHAARAAGIQVLGLLTGLIPGTLANLAGNRSLRHPLDALESYRGFVERMARRYAGLIAQWEIWNEPNTARFWLRPPRAPEFAALTAAVSKTLRDCAPDATIILGSLCGNDVDFLAPGIPRGYLAALLELGIAEHVDGIGIHPYTLACYLSLRGAAATSAAIIARVEHFQERYPALPKPLWITEIGISRTWVRLSRRQIAEVSHAILEDFTTRGLPTYLWCLTDFASPQYSRGNPERAFGLADPDLNLNATGLRLCELLHT